MDAVRQTVEGAAGDSSRNEFFEVDPQHAGAPAVCPSSRRRVHSLWPFARDRPRVSVALRYHSPPSR